MATPSNCIDNLCGSRSKRPWKLWVILGIIQFCRSQNEVKDCLATTRLSFDELIVVLKKQVKEIKEGALKALQQLAPRISGTNRGTDRRFYGSYGKGLRRVLIFQFPHLHQAGVFHPVEPPRTAPRMMTCRRWRTVRPRTSKKR